MKKMQRAFQPGLECYFFVIVIIFIGKRGETV